MNILIRNGAGGFYFGQEPVWVESIWIREITLVVHHRPVRNESLCNLLVIGIQVLTHQTFGTTSVFAGMIFSLYMSSHIEACVIPYDTKIQCKRELTMRAGSQIYQEVAGD